jgi:hypothetical protein
LAKRLELAIDRLRYTSSESEGLQTSVVLVEMIAPFPALREHLQVELQLLGQLRGVVSTDLRPMLGEFVENEAALERVVDTIVECVVVEPLDLLDIGEAQRKVFLHPGGLESAKSVKFRNLQLDLGRLSQLLGATLTIGANLIGGGNPWAAAAAVLMLIRSLTNMLTVSISETDASVFWGMIQSCDEDRNAEFSTILGQTNAARSRRGLEPLTEQQVKRALHNLLSLKCVACLEAQPDAWKLIESFEIES